MHWIHLVTCFDKHLLKDKKRSIIEKVSILKHKQSETTYKVKRKKESANTKLNRAMNASVSNYDLMLSQNQLIGKWLIK